MPSDQQQDRVWHWASRVFTVLLALAVALFLTFFVVPHMDGSTTYNGSEYDDWGDVQNRTVEGGNLSLSALPAGNDYDAPCETYHDNSSAINITWNLCDNTGEFQ